MGEQKKTGRPTKLNPEVVTKLVAAFNMGYNDTEAALYAGISRKTLYEWLCYKPDFRNKINCAKMGPTLKAKEVLISEINNGNLNAAKWWLERKATDEFTTIVKEKQEVPTEWKEHIDVLKDIIDITNKRIAYRYRHKLFSLREEERVKQATNSKKYDKPSHYENLLTRQINLSDKELANEAAMELTATGIDIADTQEILIRRNELETQLRKTIEQINQIEYENKAIILGK